MREVLHLGQVIGLLLVASAIFSLPPKTAGASPGMYLPLVLKSYGGPPPLTVKNNCSYTIWVQQSKEHKLTDTPLIQKIEAGQSFDYAVDPKGILSTRFWPKWGCNAQGQECTWGQSRDGSGGPDDYPPCPAGGCHPAVDSLMEITWGCAYQDPANNPSCENKAAVTSYDGSLVDGYSLPFKITRSGDTADSCQDIDCSGLTLAACPTKEDLTHGNRDKTTIYPQHASVNLNVSNQGTPTACFSPCGYMTSATAFGGKQLPSSDDQAILYCCPTPKDSPIFILSPECNAGPVPKTQYVNLIHQKCPKTYGFAYDDLQGLYNCHVKTKFTLTYCP
jgi:hypothetical protein